RCERWRPGARRSKAIAAATIRPADGSGSWTWSRRLERNRGLRRDNIADCELRIAGLRSPSATRNPRSTMPRILLIDDTPEISELLTYSLRDHGYEVATSGFTGEINDLIAEVHADALVFDCTALEMSESLFDSVRSVAAQAA